MKNKEVILVTDGDQTAYEAIEKASKELGLRIISKSAGNPTPHSGEDLLEMIFDCPTDPVIIMFDDQGNLECGAGELAMKTVIKSSKTDVLGVLAVASDSKEVIGISPNYSITKDGQVVETPVNKKGEKEREGHIILEGDTVDVINQFDDLLVIGIGDIGKMEGEDSISKGAPITTKAIQEILKRSDK